MRLFAATTLPLALLAAVCTQGTGSQAGSEAATDRRSAEGPPPGVEQILPRGRIAAIVAPRFVSAAEADVPDAAWVLGVVLDGQARAYSLNLLNRHEVVNDRIGERAFAAVW